LKILAITHSLTRTGAPLALLRLLREIRQQHEITLICPFEKTGALVDDIIAGGLTLSTEARLRNFDIVICNTLVSGPIVTRAHQAGVPALLWVHEGNAGRAWLASGKIDPIIFQQASLVVFPTEWQARDPFAAWVGASRWAFVSMGIPRPPEGAKVPFERGGHDGILLQAGSLEHRKGADLSVQAVRRLASYDILMFFVGARHPRFDPGIRDDERDRFIEIGPQSPEETLAFMQHADILLLPTRDDVIPLVILEAMSLGTCVLASDFGAIPETVRHGRTGLLSPTGDFRVLSGNIAMALKDPALRADLGAAGQAICHQRHDFSRHVAEMLEAIAVAAAGRGPPGRVL
jgi:glycosyltransferase involved in cell wall biosynthesis